MQATPQDWARVRALRLEALRESPDAFWAELHEEVALSSQEWQQRLAVDGFAVLIATLDGTDAGLIGVGRSHHAEGECGISMMWVAPAARGRGVGDALIDAAVAWAREQGYPRVRLWVSDTNTAAERLYARHGFDRTGVLGRYRPPREHITEHERARRL